MQRVVENESRIRDTADMRLGEDTRPAPVGAGVWLIGRKALFNFTHHYSWIASENSP